jgi:hypothetical protein
MTTAKSANKKVLGKSNVLMMSFINFIMILVLKFYRIRVRSHQKRSYNFEVIDDLFVILIFDAHSLFVFGR